MNETIYCQAMEHIRFRPDGEQELLRRVHAGEKPRRLSPSARIPVKIRRAAGDRGAGGLSCAGGALYQYAVPRRGGEAAPFHRQRVGRVVEIPTCPSAFR